MLLSILIPSIPSRFEKAQAMYNSLVAMSEGKEIEILMLTDNKKRTIGEKCNDLKAAAKGKYIIYIHDDDELTSLEEIYEAAKGDYDVISYDAICRNADGSTYFVNQQLGNEVEHKTDEAGNYQDLKRPPFPNCAWHNKFKQYDFPHISYSEDWEWIKQLLPLAVSEYHIDNPLFKYNFDPKVTEADTTSNPYWTNPNEVQYRRAIVNLSTMGYHDRQQRMIFSIAEHSDIEIITYQYEAEVGAPPHKQNPYSFKIYAIEKVKEQGYNSILWLDASAYAIADPSPIFEIIEKEDYFLEEAGHYAGTWTNDRALGYFGITRDEAMKIPLYSAGWTGLNFNSEVTREFFARWKNAMEAGMFKGEWTNKSKTESYDSRCEGHRHDMACASIIAYQLGMKLQPCGKYFQYASPETPVNQPTVIFKAN